MYVFLRGTGRQGGRTERLGGRQGQLRRLSSVRRELSEVPRNLKWPRGFGVRPQQSPGGTGRHAPRTRFLEGPPLLRGLWLSDRGEFPAPFVMARASVGLCGSMAACLARVQGQELSLAVSLGRTGGLILLEDMAHVLQP